MNTQITFIGLGQLFIQVSSFGIPGVHFRLNNESTSELRRIWPPRTTDIVWPTPIIDREGIAKIYTAAGHSLRPIPGLI